MSRIGKLPITLPSSVSVNVGDNNLITVKGPKGELHQQVHPDMKISVEDGTLTIERPSESKEHKSLHGLYRSLINNMTIGVSEGFRKELELIGVGFRVTNTGQLLELSLGLSHPIFLELPQEVKVETKMERNKTPKIILESCDKQLIGQVCAKIRSFRKPEPYKGKGVRFVGEEVRRKSGKTAATAK
ncbi:MAG: 50S ribosomal protein L6 [Dysgonamonadaceae bacterium]|jgi:large subunit ribosomal protein L6|nr:50S ribosomal protein L6 [Dysgonamonadaceae bacterium]MDD3355299.1 50S ribosomal protein L6 [Dysgonamonadaceae bacterium]MDD3727818.1 50S ribosomal protein L6 [Dysgonamonadaceae bacterium]MDD4245606.1 50S ribosomal protein L6 [Dysgonamonadaceae bacterium]MDD4605056.1 50S ribosomal protein L6 [Dysgonamonadaceae bacterium]